MLKIGYVMLLLQPHSGHDVGHFFVGKALDTPQITPQITPEPPSHTLASRRLSVPPAHAAAADEPRGGRMCCGSSR